VCVQCVPIAREETDSSDFLDSAEGLCDYSENSLIKFVVVCDTT